MVKFNSKEENPGVSPTIPSLDGIRTTSLVMCFPLPNASENSPTILSIDGSMQLIILDLPAPVCPIKAIVLPLIISFNGLTLSGFLADTIIAFIPMLS